MNQQRVHGLTSGLAEAEEVGTSLDELVGTVRHEHYLYEHLTWAVGTRDRPAAFELPYLQVAQVLYAKHRNLGIDPPVHDRNAPDPLEVDRAELLRIVETIYGSLDPAFDELWDRRDQLAPRAAAETRMVHGIEANRLLKTFERKTDLHSRAPVPSPATSRPTENSSPSKRTSTTGTTTRRGTNPVRRPQTFPNPRNSFPTR